MECDNCGNVTWEVKLIAYNPDSGRYTIYFGCEKCLDSIEINTNKESVELQLQIISERIDFVRQLEENKKMAIEMIKEAFEGSKSE